MQLSDLRSEVLAHGFDPVQFGSSRVTSYLNDGYLYICTSGEFYTDEATQDFTTVNGTASYALPANFARVRSLRDTNRTLEMQAVSLRKIDRSSASSGAPLYYAMDGANLHLYPTPNSSAYPMELRYWLLPNPLVNDTDVPTIPASWHWLIWHYAVARCYKAEDDFTMGAQWQNDFKLGLTDFLADLKFPSDDAPTQAASWFSSGSGLGGGWSFSGIG